MKTVLVLIFLGFAAVAAGFVALPILRRGGEPLRGRAVLATAATLLVLGIGGGLYLMLGSPGLALRSLTGAGETDLRGLVAELVTRVRTDPQDLTAWTLLGRGYLTLGDPSDAASAFRRAIPLTPPAERATVYSAYGVALTMANSGAVPPEAEAAFQSALKTEPTNEAARFYLGFAYAGRRETDKALAIWQGLLDDAPANAPWRGMLTDRIATLRAQAGGGTPDVTTMVGRLAARLKSEPHDPDGWQRLIRAYAVLGETDKARSALADAHAALKGDTSALSAIEAEAASLNLQK